MFFWGANFDIVMIFSKKNNAKWKGGLFVTIELTGVKAQALRRKK
jgi:hypothetical protein